MPLNLTTNEVKQTVIAKYKITEFTVNLEAQEIAVRVLKSDENGQPVAYDNIHIDGDDFPDAIAMANGHAGGNVYNAIKKSLYNKIKLLRGLSGDVS